MPAEQQELQKHIEEVARLASHPAMLKALAEIQQAPTDERLDVARRVADRAALKARGLDIGPEFRIALRSFEDPSKADVAAEQIISETAGKKPSDGGGTTVCGSVGFYVCGSVGTTI
jgi:hypothetical protein